MPIGRKNRHSGGKCCILTGLGDRKLHAAVECGCSVVVISEIMEANTHHTAILMCTVSLVVIPFTPNIPRSGRKLYKYPWKIKYNFTHPDLSVTPGYTMKSQILCIRLLSRSMKHSHHQ
jgi:hypothetical protein